MENKPQEAHYSRRQISFRTYDTFRGSQDVTFVRSVFPKNARYYTTVYNRIFIKLIKTVHMYFGLTVNLFLIWPPGILFLFIPSIYIKPVVHVLLCLSFVHVINDGDRTKWSPIPSVIIQVTKSSMIVLIPINHNRYNFRKKKTFRKNISTRRKQKKIGNLPVFFAG